MKTTLPIVAAAVTALVTGFLMVPSADAGHRDSPSAIVCALESGAWTTVSMFDEDIRYERRRQTPSERAFHDHLISLKHDFHEIGEALERRCAVSLERALFATRSTLDCAIETKRSVRLYRETDEFFCRLVHDFAMLEERLTPRHHHGHDHHNRAPEPRYEERRPARYSSHDSRQVDPREMILRSILSHLANR